VFDLTTKDGALDLLADLGQPGDIPDEVPPVRKLRRFVYWFVQILTVLHHVSAIAMGSLPCENFDVY
jgi:hypothetical protein